MGSFFVKNFIIKTADHYPLKTKTWAGCISSWNGCHHLVNFHVWTSIFQSEMHSQMVYRDYFWEKHYRLVIFALSCGVQCVCAATQQDKCAIKGRRENQWHSYIPPTDLPSQRTWMSLLCLWHLLCVASSHIIISEDDGIFCMCKPSLCFSSVWG